jgi:hypothetical protein
MRAIALALLIAIAAGCGESPDGDNRREVEKPARYSPLAPVSAMDDATRIEALPAMRVIHQAIQMTLTRGASLASLAAELQGHLDAAKLARIGLNENSLVGSFYEPGDYHLAFAGTRLTITARNPGERGYVTQDFALR